MRNATESFPRCAHLSSATSSLLPDRPNSETWAVEKALYHVTLDDLLSLRRAALPAALDRQRPLVAEQDMLHSACTTSFRRVCFATLMPELSTALAPDLQLRELTPSHQRDPVTHFGSAPAAPGTGRCQWVRE